MYQKFYMDVALNSQLNFRQIERETIIRVITDLQRGLEDGPESIETIKACAVIQKMWTILIVDLLQDENQLSVELRAGLISIGLWIQREVADILAGKSSNFSGIIDVMFMIADGLV